MGMKWTRTKVLLLLLRLKQGRWCLQASLGLLWLRVSPVRAMMMMMSITMTWTLRIPMKPGRQN